MFKKNLMPSLHWGMFFKRKKNTFRNIFFFILFFLYFCKISFPSMLIGMQLSSVGL